MRSFPSRLSPSHRVGSLHFLLDTDLSLIVRSEFIKRFCKRDRGMLETLATWMLAFWHSLADARKARVCLGPPFVKTSSTVRRRELNTTFGPDHLDVVGTCAIAAHELFLFLVPSNSGLGAFLCNRPFVSGEIKRGMPCLLGKSFPITQGVPKLREPNIDESEFGAPFFRISTSLTIGNIKFRVMVLPVFPLRGL
jgi:hypothetical protein